MFYISLNHISITTISVTRGLSCFHCHKMNPDDYSCQTTTQAMIWISLLPFMIRYIMPEKEEGVYHLWSEQVVTRYDIVASPPPHYIWLLSKIRVTSSRPCQFPKPHDHILITFRMTISLDLANCLGENCYKDNSYGFLVRQIKCL